MMSVTAPWRHLAARLAGGLALALAAVPAARGEGLSYGPLTLNAFGTFGVVHSTDRQADFVFDAAQPKGAGFSHPWSTTPDTRFGAQLTARLGDRFTGVLQAVSKYRYDGTFRPELEWANLKFDVTPGFSVRAGRIALPTFLFSDSQAVGFVLPNVRIPPEIYWQLPMNSSDGIDATYRYELTGMKGSVQVLHGRRRATLSGDGVIDVYRLQGVAATLESGATTLHLSHQVMHYSLIIGNGGPTFHGNRQSITSVGIIYDPGPWFVHAEGLVSPDRAFGRYVGGYVLGGYRTGAWTPYAGYASVYMARPGDVAATSFADQHTTTLGVRWDLVRNVAMKLQFDAVKRRGGRQDFWLNQQPDFRSDGRAQLLSLTVDFAY